MAVREPPLKKYNQMLKKLYTQSKGSIIIPSLIIGGVILLGFYLLAQSVQSPENSAILQAPRVKDKKIKSQQANPSTLPTIKESLSAQTELKKFSGYKQMRTFLENHAQQAGSGIWGRGGMVDALSEKIMAPSRLQLGEARDGRTTSSSDYSTTNIQVQGVDEADIVKTDGSYVYALAKQNLFIVQAIPGEQAEILVKIAFQATPQGMYLYKNRLVLYGDDDALYQNIDARIPEQILRRRSPYTFVKIFDITDKKNPQLVKDLKFEGYYINSRMVNGYAYFITNTYSYAWFDDAPVPIILENGAPLSTDTSKPHCNCPDVFYFDIPFETYNAVSVIAVNISEESAPISNQLYLLPPNENLYASPNNLYIAYTKYLNEFQLSVEVSREIIYPRLTSEDQDRIQLIERAENFLLSPDEKLSKINFILDRYMAKRAPSEQESISQEIQTQLEKKYEELAEELEKTVIHKIAIDHENITYKISGQVIGTVLNQFSMDEDNGYFRIATTRNRSFSRFSGDTYNPYSSVYVLDADMKLAGKVEHLAPGERIYSARFMQNRAYLVTFKQTDPLFVIDLLDPKNPTVLGALKIPGFSNYLHPYDEQTLIGLGKETEENEYGNVISKGLKISLFDVSDVANPKESAQYVLGDQGSDSIALYDHHAFLFSKDKELLVIPVDMQAQGIVPAPQEKQAGNILPPRFPKRFRGAAVLKITKDSISLKGAIDHADLKDDSPSDYWYGYNYYDTTVKRSLYIDNTLYTLSDTYLKLNNLENLQTIKSLELKKSTPSGGDDFDIIK